MARPDADQLKKFWKQETPSGTINGSNVTFTLGQTPVENDSVLVFLDGLHQVIGTHITISGSTITFTTAPATAQVVVAFYIEQRGEA